MMFFWLVEWIIGVGSSGFLWKVRSRYGFDCSIVYADSMLQRLGVGVGVSLP